MVLGLPADSVPPVAVGVVQALAEGQGMPHKLLGRRLISQLLLFRLRLQLWGGR